MKISARNQITGKVKSVKKGRVNCEVVVLSGKNKLKSTITKSAVEEMKVKKDDEVVAIIKSSNVILATKLPKKISARNIFLVKVKKIKFGDINSEIKLDLNGYIFTSVVTVSAIRDLDIKQGDKVYAIVKASDIIIAKD